jgi:hypothetical protein
VPLQTFQALEISSPLAEWDRGEGMEEKFQISLARISLPEVRCFSPPFGDIMIFRIFGETVYPG